MVEGIPYMKRRFLPVGHGAFYCEQFYLGDNEPPINIVYDCGTKSGQKLLEKQIDRTFQPGSEIHAIFLSHLHRDHVSGLVHLLKRCKVDKVYFPELEDVDKTLLAYECQTTDPADTFTPAFLLDPKSTMRALDAPWGGEREAIPVPVERPFTEGASSSSPGDTSIGVLSGKHVSSQPFRDWVFKARNFAQPESVAELKKTLAATFGEPITSDTLRNAWEHYNEKIKGIFKANAKRDYNTNSMVLFSGIRGWSHSQFAEGNHYGPGKPLSLKAAGCLYTGDFTVKENWDALQMAYCGYWDAIGIVQLPHHGSDNNYRKELFDRDAFFVISAPVQKTVSSGAKKTHFPGKQVKAALEKKEWYCVTEEEESAKNFHLFPPTEWVKMRVLFPELMQMQIGP